MPPDGKGSVAADDRKAVAEKLKAWIEKFNKAKGWQTIAVPGAAKGAVTTIKGSLKKALAEAKAQRATAERLSDKATQAADAAEKALAEAKGKNARKQAERACLDAKEEAAFRFAEFEQASRDVLDRDAALKALRSSESDLNVNRNEIVSEVLDLRAKVEGLGKDQGIATLDDDTVGAFLARHQKVAAAVDAARAMVIEVPDRQGGEPKKIQGVNTPEYKLLFAMLEKALLIFQSGDAAGAGAALDKAEEKLKEFLVARRTAARSTDNFREAAPSVAAARAKIDILRKAGFEGLANVNAAKLVERGQAFAEQRPNATAEHRDDLVESLRKLDIEIQQQVEMLGQFTTLKARYETGLEALRSLGKADKAKDLDDGFVDTKTARTVAAAIMAGEGRLEELDGEVDAARRALLEAKNADPAKLEEKIARMDAFFAEVLKMRDTSKIRQLGPGGAEKRATHNIPDAAIKELEYRIGAAKMMMKSDHPDALALAQQYIAGVEDFETGVLEGGKTYEKVETKIDEIEVLVERMATKYVAYDPQRQADVRQKLESFKETYQTTPADEAFAEASEIFREARDLKTAFQNALKAYEAFLAKAKRVDGLLDDVGKRLIFTDIPKDAEKDVHRFTGYHGTLRADLDRQRTKAESRDPTDIAQAGDEVDRIETKANTLLATAQKALDVHYSRDPNRMAEFRASDAWKTLSADAVKGEEDRKARDAQKKDFKAKYDAAEKTLAKLAKTHERLKLDVDEIKALGLRLKGAKQAADSDDDWAAALTLLGTEIQPQIDRLAENTGKLDAALDTKTAPIDATCLKCVQLLVAVGTKVGDVRTAIKDRGGLQSAKLALDASAQKAVADYLDTLEKSLATERFQPLLDAAKTLQKSKGKLDKDARKARENMLAQIRATMRLLDGSSALRLFRRQPFLPDIGLDAARAQLEIVETVTIRFFADT